MNGSRLRVIHVIYDKYQAEYNAVFDPDLDASIATLPAGGKPGMPEWEMLTADQKMVMEAVEPGGGAGSGGGGGSGS